MNAKLTQTLDPATLSHFTGTAQYWRAARQFVINQADEMPNATNCFQRSGLAPIGLTGAQRPLFDWF